MKNTDQETFENLEQTFENLEQTLELAQQDCHALVRSDDPLCIEIGMELLSQFALIHQKLSRIVMRSIAQSKEAQ